MQEINIEINSETPEQTREEWAIERVKEWRLKAYADPQTGSDRHFTEAARLEAVGDTEGAELARTVGLVRYDEIRSQYPWPEQ